MIASALHTLTLVPLTGQVLVLLLTLSTGLWAAHSRTRLSVLALSLCAAMWLRANSHLEGTVLITFTPAHGLTLADLLVPSLLALVLAGRSEQARRLGVPMRSLVLHGVPVST